MKYFKFSHNELHFWNSLKSKNAPFLNGLKEKFSRTSKSSKSDRSITQQLKNQMAMATSQRWSEQKWENTYQIQCHRFRLQWNRIKKNFEIPRDAFVFEAVSKPKPNFVLSSKMCEIQPHVHFNIWTISCFRSNKPDYVAFQSFSVKINSTRQHKSIRRAKTITAVVFGERKCVPIKTQRGSINKQSRKMIFECESRPAKHFPPDKVDAVRNDFP